MTMGDSLWTPPGDVLDRCRMGDFLRFVERRLGVRLYQRDGRHGGDGHSGGHHGGDSADAYQALWQWSVDDLAGFWSAIWDYFDVVAYDQPTRVLAEETMPGTRWFEGATLNYAEHVLRMPGLADADPVVLAFSQTRPPVTLTAAELREQVRRARAGLRRLGVGPGDRVAAYAPNIPETFVLMLATTSLGAVFSSCAPEFGTRSVVDRWRQIEPRVLMAVDGYRYGGKTVDRRGEVAEIRAALPSLAHVVWLPYLGQPDGEPAGRSDGHDDLTWTELAALTDEPLAFTPVPFEHPLYVLYTSGTTGLPKPIVHGHGGILLEHLKSLALHLDLGPGDRFFWFSTTGWMMWNLLVSGPAVGAAVVLFDGDPGAPDLGELWRLAQRSQMTYFGASAPFLLACRKAGLVPRELVDTSRLRAVGSTGAPLPPEGFRWVAEAVASSTVASSTVASSTVASGTVAGGRVRGDRGSGGSAGDGVQVGGLQVQSVSGGTDVCTGFVGAAPLVPVREGQISCRCLGARVEAFDSAGQPVVGQVGELVLTAPMPSMPVGFWNDPDGSRYREAYFDAYPGVWRHGDWVTFDERGSCVISGRSDATLNRGGVRVGTSELYSVVESLDEVVDSLAVHLEDAADGPGDLLLFVVLTGGTRLDDALCTRIQQALRTTLSPRYVPDEILQVSAVPRTLSAKKLEVPVKRILAGTPVELAVAKGALANPDSLADFEMIARRRALSTAADSRSG